MTQNQCPTPRILSSPAKLAAGIQFLLADNSAGRRDVPWLSERSGIPKSSLRRKIARPETITTADLCALADAFSVDVVDLYKAGDEAAATPLAA